MFLFLQKLMRSNHHCQSPCWRNWRGDARHCHGYTWNQEMWPTCPVQTFCHHPWLTWHWGRAPGNPAGSKTVLITSPTSSTLTLQAPCVWTTTIWRTSLSSVSFTHSSWTTATDWVSRACRKLCRPWPCWLSWVSKAVILRTLWFTTLDATWLLYSISMCQAQNLWQSLVCPC